MVPTPGHPLPITHPNFFYNPKSIMRVVSMYVGVQPISGAWAVY